MPPTPAVTPFPTDCHGHYAATSLSWEGVCLSQFSGGTFLDASRHIGSSRTSRESSWLAAPGMQSLHRTPTALQANLLSDGTSNFHRNSTGILHWKQPVN